jgi:hypothetical protein
MYVSIRSVCGLAVGGVCLCGAWCSWSRTSSCLFTWRRGRLTCLGAGSSLSPVPVHTKITINLPRAEHVPVAIMYGYSDFHQNYNTYYNSIITLQALGTQLAISTEAVRCSATSLQWSECSQRVSSPSMRCICATHCCNLSFAAALMLSLRYGQDLVRVGNYTVYADSSNVSGAQFYPVRKKRDREREREREKGMEGARERGRDGGRET